MPETAPRLRTTILKLSPVHRGRLQSLTQARKRTPHWLMVQAIEEYPEREEARERLNAEIATVWANSEATGHHATSEAVDAWLARLENGEDVGPPTRR